MPTEISQDGTRIDYTRGGSGPAVVLVGGAIDDGSENAPLAPALADQFTVSTMRDEAAATAVTPRHIR